MRRLTANETRLLKALVDAFSGPPDAGENYRSWKTHCRAMGNWFRPSDLQRFGFIDPDAPDSGLHRTAASLVSKGLAVRKKMQGCVHYQFTAEGRAMLTAGCAGGGHPAAACGNPDHKPESPYWRARGSTHLAQIIRGVCAVTETAAEQLAAEACDSDAGVIFETETRVPGRARLGVQPHRWLAVRRRELGSEFRLEKLS